MGDNMPKPEVQKVKGISDIVFCVDFSGSMNDCIEGLKQHINDFVSGLEASNNNNFSIDWRIAFCGYTNEDINHFEFTQNSSAFTNALNNAIGKGWSEFTPGAVDYCISNFQWREKANKFIIVFTDEDIYGGHTDKCAGCSQFGETEFSKLIRKLEKSKIYMFYYGVSDPFYKQFGDLPKSIYNDKIGRNFKTIDFSDLMSDLGKTVSATSGSGQGKAITKSAAIYDLRHFKIKKL